MTEVMRLNNGRWRSGVSGNANGRPAGRGNVFQETFKKDLAESWSEHGATVLNKVATCEPAKYLAVCASLIPRDVSLTLQSRLPGNLEPDDWKLVTEVLEAVKEGLPNAANREPGAVLAFTLDAIRSHSAPMIEAERKEKTPTQAMLDP